ncbi:MAG TPA: extracellular solute-binding protein [Candidatus Limnocylindrales bacterium]|nr:extracellular solute-binding protein [Candidatus Limnocylindrales bacterium]
MPATRPRAVLAAVIVIAIAVAACGQSAAPSGGAPSGLAGEQTVRIWTWSQWNGTTGLEPDGQPLDWWKAEVDQWKAGHPGVTVEIEDLNGQDLDINAKYDTAVAAGNIADLIWVDESYFSKYASADVLAPIDAYLTDADKADFLPKDLELSRFNGKQYFWPFITQGNHLAINVSLFKEKGLEGMLPKAPDYSWTFDEYVAAAKAVMEGSEGDLYGTGFSTDGAYTMAEAWGDHLYKQGDESKVTINTQNTIDAFKALIALTKDGTAFPGSGTGAVDLTTNFLQQRIAMINSWGIVNDVEKLPDGERFELLLVPFSSGPAGEPVVWGGVHGLAVTKQASPEREQLVMDLGRYLTSTEALQDVRAWSKPARKSILEAQAADDGYAFRDYLPMFEAYSNDAIPLMGQGPKAVPVLVKYEPLVEAMFTGDLTPEAALAQFESEANAILAQP